MTRWIVLAAMLCLGTAARAQSTQTCVDVRVGEQQAYDCINNALAREAGRAHAPINPGTLSATSPAPAVGTFDRAATAERMGNTFGHSAYSQRPARPVYNNPLVTGRSR